MEQDTRYMREALREARLAFEEGEIPIGAVVVCGGQIIAKGHNMTERLQDVSAHAEMLTLTAASEYLNGKYLNECTMYVTVEPCIMCAGALYWARLGRLVYAIADAKRGYSLFGDKVLHPKTEVCSGVLSDEALELMQLFFQSHR